MIENDDALAVLIALAVPATLVVIGVARTRLEKDRKRWQSRDATILKRFDNITPTAAGSNRAVTKFHLTYEYIVNGKRYEGSGWCSPHDYADGDLEMYEVIEGKFKIGNQITVFVNPKHSAQSAVFVEGSSYAGIFYATAALIAISTLAWICSFF